MPRPLPCPPSGGGPNSVPVIYAQPLVEPLGIAWLGRIMLAHRRDTWAEAAEIVLAAIEANPEDPVRTWEFVASDVPSSPRRILGWSWMTESPCHLRLQTSVLLRLTPEQAHLLKQRAGGHLGLSRSASAVLAVAHRLDPGDRYFPARE